MQLRDPWKKLLFAAIILSAMDGNAQKSGSNDPIQWCYCYIDAHEGESVWRKTDCDLTTLDEKQIISLQYKLKNAGYNLEVTGTLNSKTSEAYVLEKKKKYSKT